MTLRSWGNYPRIKNKAFCFNNIATLQHIINEHDGLIPYGNGRSYGDSALSENIIHVGSYNYLLDFNQESGLLHVQAGVLLSDIIKIFISKGWFLKISPGTKMVTVGGAIASDVHGKNHHVKGCFSECVSRFTLMLPNNQIVQCSKQENVELFKATCGGMGLTGVILCAAIWLEKINSSYIHQITIKTKNLKETFAAFEEYKHHSYSVAWIDCFAKNDHLGKCILTVGDFCNDSNFNYKSPKNIHLPFYFPSWFLNNFTVKLFNWFYYQRIRKKLSQQRVTIDDFFYPLDAIGNWNRIYGKKGFLQYQFILPLETSFDGLKKILKEIANYKKSSFLTTLKLYGEANHNYLSFPMKGYSLALDFKIEKGLFELLNKLDELVLKYKGRIYLTKDSRVSKEVFEQGYPYIQYFRQLRIKYKMNIKLNSLQSRRIKI